MLTKWVFNSAKDTVCGFLPFQHLHIVLDLTAGQFHSDQNRIVSMPDHGEPLEQQLQDSKNLLFLFPDEELALRKEVGCSWFCLSQMTADIFKDLIRELK